MSEKEIEGQLACLRMICGYVLAKTVNRDPIELEATLARLERAFSGRIDPLISSHGPDFDDGFRKCLDEFLLIERRLLSFMKDGGN